MNININKVKIFVTIPSENAEEVRKVISKLREKHPYEEPAIDIVPLLGESYFR